VSAAALLRALLDPLDPAGVEVRLRRALGGLLRLSGARAGRLLLHGPGAPLLAVAGRAPRHAVVRRVRLGRAAALELVGARRALPPGLARRLGAALARVGEAHRRARARALAEALERLGAEGAPLDDLAGALAAGLAELVAYDAAALALVDAGRETVTVLDLEARVRGWGARRDERRPLAGTLFADVVATGAPRRVDDLAAADVPPVSRTTLAGRGWRAALLVPLAAGGRVLGALTLAARAPRAFAEADLAVLGAPARALAGALALGARVEESRRQTRALLAAGRAVTASLDVERTIRVILTEARNVLDAASCGVMTCDEATGELVLIASLDLPMGMSAGVRLRPGEGIAGRAFQEGRPVQSPDIAADPRVRYPELPLGSGLRSMLAVPLTVGPRAIGAIAVFRRDVHRFTADEEELLRALADQAAIALEHARLYERLEAMVAERTRELDAEKRFVEVVLETLPLGLVVLDQARRVVRANPEAGRVLGAAPADGAPLDALLPSEAAGALRDLVDAALAGRGPRTTERELTLGGEPRTLRLTAAPVATAAGHVILLAEDVTLAKRLERQMLLTERLTTAGRLAAGVAHELNNPLATIAGCAEALQARLREGGAGAVGDEFAHYLRLIEEEAFRCKEITGSLLHFVREPDSRRAPADLNALVQKTVELLSHQSRFSGRRFVTELDPDLPPVVVNEGQLRQVFLGLAANALEAMGEAGTLTIRSRRRRGEVEVEFEDDGPGIPDDVLPRIFDPFFTTKPPGQGTGLGLAIAQGIVTDHGGRIEVASRVGRGARFRVVLPA